MLKVTIPSIEQFDESNNEFITHKEQILNLEHSLVSVSKWESKWHKPFLSREEKTIEETVDYIKCMTITQNVDDEVYRGLTNDNLISVREYLQEDMTATTISNDKKTTNREIITAEIIYYWMISLNIPFECQKWHLNKLLMLINVCNIKSQPQKKMNKRDIARRNASLNEERKNKMEALK